MIESLFVKNALAQCGLEKYVPAFNRNDIAEDVFFDLTEEDLIEIGILDLSDRLSILKVISDLKPKELQKMPLSTDVVQMQKRVSECEEYMHRMFSTLVAMKTRLSELEKDSTPPEEDDGITIVTPGVFPESSPHRNVSYFG